MRLNNVLQRLTAFRLWARKPSATACLPCGHAILRWVVLPLVLSVVMPQHSAAAEGAQVAAAQMLFEQGRDLLRAGHSREACPKLAESQRLDPATGTLLALAMCHEAEGLLATAWAEYSAVVSRAKRDNQIEREQWARQRAAELKPRLSMLELRVPESLRKVPGLELRRNGVLLGQDAWNLPVPVDPGYYEVTASAPDKLRWHSKIEVRAEADDVVVALPDALAEAAAASPTLDMTTPAAGSAAFSPRAVDPTVDHAVQAEPVEVNTAWSTWQWVGASTAGAGLVSLAVSGGLLVYALDLNAESLRDCSGNECGDEGIAARDSARRWGNAATAVGIGGGLLTLTGAALFWLGGETPSDSAQRGVRPVLLQAAPGHVHLQWTQSF